MIEVSVAVMKLNVAFVKVIDKQALITEINISGKNSLEDMPSPGNTGIFFRM